jgi:hypothetical protein
LQRYKQLLLLQTIKAMPQFHAKKQTSVSKSLKRSDRKSNRKSNPTYINERHKVLEGEAIVRTWLGANI